MGKYTTSNRGMICLNIFYSLFYLCWFFKIAGVLLGILLLINLFFNATPANYRNIDLNKIIDSLRVTIMSDDTFRIGFILLLGTGSLYAISRKWLNELVGMGIITLIAVVDVGIVDKMIIEPTPESYRASTLKKKEFLHAYLKEDDVIRFLKSDTTKFRILPWGKSLTAYQIEVIENINKG